MQKFVAGLGAVGALSAAVAGGVYMTRGDRAISPAPTRATLTLAGAETVCIRTNVSLVEGMRPGCLTRAEFEALRDRAVIGGDARLLTLDLTSPNGAVAPKSAATCAEYDSMTRAGWYAASAADMRREEYFRRACGALAMLTKAKPAATSNFANGRANREDVVSMANADALSFGEATPSASVDVVEAQEGVWKITIGAGETMIFEIAHADFTGDGVGEILAYASVGAVGGTARTGTIGLMEKPGAGGPCSFSAR
jgi:hypothetical protein